MLGSELQNGRSLPATHRLYNPSALDIGDAADGLLNGTELPQGATGPGVLLTADGGRYEGDLFGADVLGSGELVFTTGMMGYQESLTDPSFAGQVLTFTYPLIGNYGIHQGTSESKQVWPRGVVVRHAMHQPDHRNSIGSSMETSSTRSSNSGEVSASNLDFNCPSWPSGPNTHNTVPNSRTRRVMARVSMF